MTVAPTTFSASGNRIDLALQDIGPLFSIMRVSWNAMSPLAVMLDSHAQTKGSAGDRLSVNPQTIDPRIAAILARPEVRINHLVATSSAGWSVFMACWRRADPDRFVVLIPRSPEKYSIVWFDSAASYLAWWLVEVTTTADRTIPNYLPPQLPLPTLIYALHAVDSHRRATLRRASEYGVSEPLWISAADFAATMRKAITSRDARWLLPAFASLTPGVISLLREPSVDELSWLDEAAFLHPRPHTITGENGFVFGEAAEAFGEEMPGGLKTAMGFSIDVSADNRSVPLEQVFIAPTDSSNHLIRIEAGDEGVVANHQAMTQAHLYMKLDATLSAALRPNARQHALTRVEQLSRRTRASEPLATPKTLRSESETAMRACSQCGHANSPNQRFCGECGHAMDADSASRKEPPRPSARPMEPLPPTATASQSRWAPPPAREMPRDSRETAATASPIEASISAKRFCRQCGAALTPGSRFCRKCGNDAQAAKAK